MFGFSINDLGNLFAQQVVQPTQQSQNKAPPPASKRLLSNLPKVTITADDLVEQTNKECVICLMEQQLGHVAVKLPCGHIYHETCLKEWLLTHCTCPVCRYELETDDAAYEKERLNKMKNRKLRCRRDELEGMSISKLKELLKQLSINCAGCVDKRELVERLIVSGQVEITEGMPTMEMQQEEFESKSVGELKKLLLSFGISSAGMMEKHEMRTALLESGRVVITGAPPPPAPAPAEENSSGSRDRMAGNDEPPCPATGATEEEIVQFPYELLISMSVKELKLLMNSYAISCSGCVEKDDLIYAIEKSGKFLLMHE